MGKKNLAAITGFLVCAIMIMYGIVSNGGIQTLPRFIHGPSAIITFGGAFFAVMITSDSFKDYIDGLKCFFYAFKKSDFDIDELCGQIIELANLSRKDGLLSLEEQTSEIENDLMKKGIRLIVDGTDPELVKDIMETERFHCEERNQKRIQFWKDLGAYAPAWGMVGTLLGLINMMHAMGDDPNSIGAGMALALITTLYGSILANWLCIPLSRKLEKSSDQENLIMEIVTEGVLSIQAGDNPAIIREKLRAFRDGKEEQE